jgi:hypothetical protein
MKRSMAGTVLLVVALWSTSAGQELNIGPTVGALFAPGGRGFSAGMCGREGGASALLGFEAVYSLPTAPFDLVGQFSFSSIEGGHGRRDTLAAPAGGQGGAEGGWWEPLLCRTGRTMGAGGRAHCPLFRRHASPERRAGATREA